MRTETKSCTKNTCAKNTCALEGALADAQNALVQLRLVEREDHEIGREDVLGRRDVAEQQIHEPGHDDRTNCAKALGRCELSHQLSLLEACVHTAQASKLQATRTALGRCQRAEGGKGSWRA